MFEIIAHHRTYSFTVRLPDHMQAIHLVFHASMLEPTSSNTIPNRVQPPPAPVVIDGEPEFEISDILDSKIDKRRKACKLLYLVRWTGYEGTDEETSWILTSELDHTSELVQDFHKSYPAKPGPLPITVIPWESQGLTLSHGPYGNSLGESRVDSLLWTLEADPT